SPTNSLSVRGSSFSYMDFGLGGTSKAVIGTDSSGSFIVFDPVASKYRLAIDSTGNVGLFGDLVVQGQASVRGTSFSYLNFSFGGEVKSVIGTDANGRFILYDPVGGRYRLTVDSSGGVKMGDLYVTGNVRVDGNIAAKYQDVAEWVPTS